MATAPFVFLIVTALVFVSLMIMRKVAIQKPKSRRTTFINK